MITQAFSNRIKQLNEKHLKFLDKHQLIDKQVKLIAKEYVSIRNNLQIESLKVSTKRKKFNEIINQREQVITQLRASKCFGCEQVSYHMSQIEVYERYKTQMEEIDKILTGNVDEKEKDFENRNIILKVLYIQWSSQRGHRVCRPTQTLPLRSVAPRVCRFISIISVF